MIYINSTKLFVTDIEKNVLNINPQVSSKISLPDRVVDLRLARHGPGLEHLTEPLVEFVAHQAKDA
jgi:hypothetical protein